MKCRLEYYTMLFSGTLVDFPSFLLGKAVKPFLTALPLSEPTYYLFTTSNIRIYVEQSDLAALQLFGIIQCQPYELHAKH